jgi:hypothetical protein
MKVPKTVKEAGELPSELFFALAFVVFIFCFFCLGAPVTTDYAVSQAAQIWTLLKRGTRNSMRAPQVIWLRFALYFMLVSVFRCSCSPFFSKTKK